MISDEREREEERTKHSEIVSERVEDRMMEVSTSERMLEKGNGVSTKDTTLV